MGMTRSKRQTPVRKGGSSDVRRLTCGTVMGKPHALYETASVHDVLEAITKHDWDHIFIVDNERVPVGRIHAVDVLKLVARKSVNRNIAWMLATPAKQLVNIPPLSVRKNTPLLKAGALMLTHDLNQLAVVDDDGSLTGVVSHASMARYLPQYIL